MPDVIVYVCKGDDRISYIRYTAKHFQDQNSKPQLFYFKPDRSKSPKLRDDQAGIVKMRISVCLKQAFNEGAWSKPIPKPVPRLGTLFAFVYHVDKNFKININLIKNKNKKGARIITSRQRRNI